MLSVGLAFELNRMCFVYKDEEKKRALVKIDGSLQGEWNFVLEVIMTCCRLWRSKMMMAIP